MSLLRVYPDTSAEEFKEFSSFDDIRNELKKVGVSFERWKADAEISEDAEQEQILAAYKADVDKLMSEKGFVTADVIAVTPQTENHPELRKKFLNEHTHSEDEARFFIDGKGLFCIHSNDHIYAMLCEKDDLINVPAETKHWFDMGPEPAFKCIRVFSTKEGWVANFTESDIAQQYPRLEA